MKRLCSIFEPLLLGCVFLHVASFAAMLSAETIAPHLGKVDPKGKTVWYDAKLIGVEGKGWTDTLTYYDRLPARAKGKATPRVWHLSSHTAGICVPLTTNATSVTVRWTVRHKQLAMPHMPATGVSGVDLYGRDADGKWRFIDNGRPTRTTNKAKFTVTPGRDYLLYLPLYNGIKSLEIGVPRGRQIASLARDRHKPIVFYGTSITQGACASRPGMATPAIVGRKLDVPIVNLGFSGSGKMEPEMADLLAELDASIYVLDCLRNMTVEMTETRVEPFVRKLRTARPNTPIVLAEDASFKDITPTTKGRIIRALHDKLTGEGIKNVYFLPNTGMLGDDHEGTVDGTHPNDLGMMRQAEVFVGALGPILQKSAADSNRKP